MEGPASSLIDRFDCTAAEIERCLRTRLQTVADPPCHVSEPVEAAKALGRLDSWHRRCCEVVADIEKAGEELKSEYQQQCEHLAQVSQRLKAHRLQLDAAERRLLLGAKAEWEHSTTASPDPGGASPAQTERASRDRQRPASESGLRRPPLLQFEASSAVRSGGRAAARALESDSPASVLPAPPVCRCASSPPPMAAPPGVQLVSAASRGAHGGIGEAVFVAPRVLHRDGLPPREVHLIRQVRLQAQPRLL